MKYLRNDVQALWNKKKFEEVVKLIDGIDSYYLDSELLVLKACAILCSDEDKYDLKDVSKILSQAIKLNPEFYDSYQELGYYHFSVMDNNKQAKEYFKKALDIKFSADIKHLKDLKYYTAEIDNTKLRDDLFKKLDRHIINLKKLSVTKTN